MLSATGMVIHLKKGRDGPPSLACLRADGSRTWGRLHVAFPPHDLTHCAVESVFGLREAFFGLIAGGWTIDDFAAPGVAGRLPVEAVWAEHVVGLLDLERSSGELISIDALNAALATVPVGRPVAAFRQVAAAELARVRHLRGLLLAEWATLVPGDTMAVPFPFAAARGLDVARVS